MTEQPIRIGSQDDEDPALAPVKASEVPSQLDDLLSDLDKALTADVTFDPCTLPILKRPGVSVRFSTQLEEDDITAMRNRAKDKKSPDGVNNLRFCSMLLARQCQAILMHGTEVCDEEGTPLTFGHLRVRTIFAGDPTRAQSMRAADAVVKAFGSDPHVMIAANEVMDKAGFGDEMVSVEDSDPTNAS